MQCAEYASMALLAHSIIFEIITAKSDTPAWFFDFSGNRKYPNNEIFAPTFSVWAF